MRKLIFSLVVLVVLLAGFGIGQVQPAQDASAQIGSGIGNFDIAGPVIVHGSVTIADGGDLTLSDDVTVVDQFTSADVTATDDVVVTDDLSLGGDLAVSRQTTVTVTSGGSIATGGRYVQLTGGYSAVGTSTVAGCTAGDTYGKIVTFINVGSNSIVLTDTGTLVLSGNSTLGQWDSITLQCHTGTGAWIEVAETNN
jgi:hypothetical protein